MQFSLHLVTELLNAISDVNSHFNSNLASIGTAGVPGAGMVMLAMVLTSVGLPVDGIALVAQELTVFLIWDVLLLILLEMLVVVLLFLI